MNKVKNDKTLKTKNKKKAKDIKDYETMLLEMISENIKRL